MILLSDVLHCTVMFPTLPQCSAQCSLLYLHYHPRLPGDYGTATKRSSYLTWHCTVYREYCTVYSLQQTVYSVHCIVYSAQCTVNSVQCILYSVDPNVDHVQCKVHWTLCSWGIQGISGSMASCIGTVIHYISVYCSQLHSPVSPQQFCTAFHCTALHCILHCSVLYFTVQCTDLYCNVLYFEIICTVRYCILLYTALLYTIYCTELHGKTPYFFADWTLHLANISRLHWGCGHQCVLSGRGWPLLQ